MLSVSVRLENSARSFIKPSPEDDIFNSNDGSGSGPGGTVAVSALRADSGDFLLPHSAAHEAAPEESSGVPAGAEGRGQDRHHRRHLRAGHQTQRQDGAG